MTSEVNANLRQQGSYGQQREFQIVNNRNIRIAIGNKSKNKNKVFSVPILALAEKRKSRLHIAWAWFWVAISGVVAFPVYFQLKALLALQTHGMEFAILSVLAMVVIIGFAMLALNFSRKRVFTTVYSRVPLFDILIGKPDQRSYREFINTLEGYVQKTHREWNLKVHQQIAGEMRTLRRLANEGIIPQKVYEKAKDKLLAISNKTSKAT